MLLVDHNVKSVAALVDRVLAMYLGEHIAEGTADEVMRDETVRRVYLGGEIETACAPASATDAAGRRCSTCEDVERALRQGAGARRTSRLHVREGEFVSVVGLNGAGKTTLFNAISGLVPYTGDIRWRGTRCAGRSRRRHRARRHRAMPGNPRTVRRYDRAGEPRSRRPASRRAPSATSSSTGCSSCSRSCGARSGRRRARCRAASSRCWRSPAR